MVLRYLYLCSWVLMSSWLCLLWFCWSENTLLHVKYQTPKYLEKWFFWYDSCIWCYSWPFFQNCFNLTRSQFHVTTHVFITLDYIFNESSSSSFSSLHYYYELKITKEPWTNRNKCKWSSFSLHLTWTCNSHYKCLIYFHHLFFHLPSLIFGWKILVIKIHPKLNFRKHVTW